LDGNFLSWWTGRAVIIYKREKITIVDVSIEAVIASNEEEKLYKYRIMNVLVSQQTES